MLTRYRSMYLGSLGKLCNWNISCACRTLSIISNLTVERLSSCSSCPPCIPESVSLIVLQSKLQGWFTVSYRRTKLNYPKGFYREDDAGVQC